jgi:outer membrane protein assembly factor BamB
MWLRLREPHAKWKLVASVAIVVLLVGGVVAFTKLDLERRRYDPERMAKLSEAQLSPAQFASTERDDWPQWRGPNRDGLSPATGLSTSWPADGPRVVWKKHIGRGFSSLAIAGRRLYTMDEESPTEAAEKSSTVPSQEAVVCLDAKTGNQIWRFRYANRYQERFGSGPRSTPAVDGDFVYAVGPTGIFHCLRADTGEKVWRHDLVEEFHGRKMQYGVSFSPLVDGDLVYTMPGGPDGNSIAAFDKRTGALAWKTLDDPVGYSSPIAVTAAGVKQILFFTNTALVSLSPTDGNQLWRYPWNTADGFNIATPIAFGNYVFISSGYGKGCALLEIAAEAGSFSAARVYEHNRMRNHFASSVRLGDYLYGFDMTDLVCMHVRTGAIVWREKGYRTFGKGSLLIADGRLLILAEHGTLFLAAATPAGYQQQASYRVSENKCWTVPVLAGAKLYVRDESQIVCLDLKGDSRLPMTVVKRSHTQ